MTEIDRVAALLAVDGERTAAMCTKHSSCNDCRQGGCAWCIQRKACMQDAQFVCDVRAARNLDRNQQPARSPPKNSCVFSWI